DGTDTLVNVNGTLITAFGGRGAFGSQSGGSSFCSPLQAGQGGSSSTFPTIVPPNAPNIVSVDLQSGLAGTSGSPCNGQLTGGTGGQGGQAAVVVLGGATGGTGGAFGVIFGGACLSTTRGGPGGNGTFGSGGGGGGGAADANCPGGIGSPGGSGGDGGDGIVYV